MYGEGEEEEKAEWDATSVSSVMAPPVRSRANFFCPLNRMRTFATILALHPSQVLWLVLAAYSLFRKYVINDSMSFLLVYIRVSFYALFYFIVRFYYSYEK